MTERSDAHAIEAVEAMEEGEEWLDCAVTLGIDVEERIGKFFEEIGHEWNRVIAGHPRLGHGAPGEFADRARPTAGATQVVVVERGEHAVGSRVDIGFQMPVAEFVRVAKSGHRVLGSEAGSTAVGEGNESSVVVDREVPGGLHDISIV